MTFVIVPGLDGSDENHWQSLWEASWLPSAIRIEPSSWTAPDLFDWSKAITTAVDRAGSDVVFIAHSLGCLAVAHWLTSVRTKAVRGAFLVAPPDQLAPTFPKALLPTFASSPAVPLNLPAVLVASDNDPYCTVQAASRLAEGWATPLITTGPQGHINSDSDLGPWLYGQGLLTAFLTGLGEPFPA
jgi:predicted alpha/beta hydrolase family esterase